MATLKNKVALVTGAGQGIGQGIAYALADEGATVAALGRTADKLETTSQEIEARGGRALPIAADVKDPDQTTEAITTITKELGGLNIRINNAQEYNFGRLLDIDLKNIEAGWESGPLAAVRLMRTAHPHLKGDGVIINVSSGAALDASPAGIGAYAATKAALQAFSRAAAVEWAADGIRVNTIMPFARTPAVQAVLDANPGIEERLLNDVPLARIGDAETDIGPCVAFLCSPQANYITGTTLTIDGGSQHLR